MDKQKRVTIADVAKAAGVAKSTVSNALLGKAGVREETRREIEQIARELSFRPLAAARVLRNQQSLTIGVLVADIRNPVFPEIVRGIEDVASNDGFQLYLANTDGDVHRQAKFMRSLIDHQVDGFILLSQHLGGPALAEILEDAPPAVTVGRRNDSYVADYVGLDNDDAMQKLLGHLFELGHREIALVHGPVASSTVIERRGAFRREMQAAGFAVADDRIVGAEYTFEGGLQAGRTLLLDRSVTAIIGSNDLCGIGLMQAIVESGRRCPEDISVTGIDDIFLAAIPQIGLTSFRQPHRTFGSTAARRLLARLRLPLETYIPNVDLLKGELIVRTTTAPPPR